MVSTQRVVQKKLKVEKLNKAAVIVKPNVVTLEDRPLPEPSAGEIRIRLEGCGVCASGIPVWEGREWFSYPLAPGEPGHEGWGLVDALGENVGGLQLGDRVCFQSFHAFASYDIAQADQVLKLPGELKDKPFPGEPLGCAMNIFSRSDILPGQTVAVVGAGFLGLLLIQLIKSAGANVIAVSGRETSLEIAKACGADRIVRMDDHWRILEEVKRLTGNAFCDRVIEATGKEWPLNLAIEMTAERGKLIVAGFHQDGMRQVNMQTLNWRGIDMINAHERDPQRYMEGMKKAVDAVLDGRMDPFPLFTHVFSLEYVDKALNHLIERPEGFVKALIKL